MTDAMLASIAPALSRHTDIQCVGLQSTIGVFLACRRKLIIFADNCLTDAAMGTLAKCLKLSTDSLSALFLHGQLSAKLQDYLFLTAIRKQKYNGAWYQSAGATAYAM